MLAFSIPSTCSRHEHVHNTGVEAIGVHTYIHTLCAVACAFYYMHCTIRPTLCACMPTHTINTHIHTHKLTYTQLHTQAYIHPQKQQQEAEDWLVECSSEMLGSHLEGRGATVGFSGNEVRQSEEN